MIDELLAGLLGEAAFGRLGRSQRAQLLARLFFGLLGCGLGIVGAVYMLQRQGIGNAAMRASMVALFVFLACFCLFNVALARPWRWPGLLLIVSFVAMFAARLLLGA